MLKLKDVRHNYKEELRVVSLKVTPARLSVLQILENADIPLDVKAITEYLRKKNIKVNKATIFRIINSFTEKGLIRQLWLNEDKSRYELTSRKDHHHFVCQECGAIKDISDCGIDSLQKKIERKKGLFVKSHMLEFFGTCQDCQK